jgi:hypothetical protein
MSHRDVRPETTGLTGQDTAPRVYQGRRDPTAPVGEGCTVRVEGEPLDARNGLLSASPSGFEWAYGGSGPAQLAIAILAHAYGEEFACENYQLLKDTIISELPEEGWTLEPTRLTKQSCSGCSSPARSLE